MLWKIPVLSSWNWEGGTVPHLEVELESVSITMVTTVRVTISLLALSQTRESQQRAYTLIVPRNRKTRHLPL